MGEGRNIEEFDKAMKAMIVNYLSKGLIITGIV